MPLEQVLRQIYADCANLSHGCLAQVVFHTSTLAHQARLGFNPSEPVHPPQFLDNLFGRASLLAPILDPPFRFNPYISKDRSCGGRPRLLPDCPVSHIIGSRPRDCRVGVRNLYPRVQTASYLVTAEVARMLQTRSRGWFRQRSNLCL